MIIDVVIGKRNNFHTGTMILDDQNYDESEPDFEKCFFGCGCYQPFTLDVLVQFYIVAEFRSVVKDTKSNTKYFTKSISIHSDYQSVHFW